MRTSIWRDSVIFSRPFLSRLSLLSNRLHRIDWIRWFTSFCSKLWILNTLMWSQFPFQTRSNLLTLPLINRLINWYQDLIMLQRNLLSLRILNAFLKVKKKVKLFQHKKVIGRKDLLLIFLFYLKIYLKLPVSISLQVFFKVDFTLFD